MKKAILFCIITALILGNFNFINIAADQEESKTICEENPSYLNRDVRIVKPTIDQNCNKISDNLENSPFALSDSETMIDVIVALDHSPNVSDISTIELFGGVVYETWDELIFALHAKIPQKNLVKYALNDEVVLIEENAEIQTCLDYSVKQMRVRPTVWDNYGYSGNSSHAIAILDTGIDDSHPDLSGKIVKWKDFTDDNYNNPIDKGEHGTHCAGIAVGSGTKSGTNTKKYTWSSYFDYYHDPPWPTYVAPSKSGALQVNLEWDDDYYNGTGEGLIWIDKNQNEMVESGEYITGSTPLTYSASVNSGRYKVGVQANDSAASLEDFYCQIDVPTQSLGDGHNLLTGVAPNCKLAGLKVFDDSGNCTTAESIDAINWLALNAETYNIIAASMSYSGEVSDTEDTAVNNLVSSGVVCVVAAGNDQGTIYVGGPGTAAKAITVGAVNEEDELTAYSSIGDPGRTPIKPDVLAPGGSFNMGDKIISVDSNDADETWELDLDCYSDDYRAMAGTSMSCPHVSGLAALVANAMGTWQYTEEQALKVKQIILMTSYEIGSAENGSYTPPFNHGGKDNKEGYGRICADAAIEAATMELNISDNTFSFGIEVYDKKVWARQVELTTDKTYTFSMDVPDTGNYDLYSYDKDPDSNGEPVLKESSYNIGSTDESIEFTCTDDGIYYIVVKWRSGYGQAEVNVENDPPVAFDDFYGVVEDDVLFVPEPGVLENDTDTEGNPLTAIKVSDPSNGLATLNANGSFVYTPNPDYSGSDSFTYKANDSMSDSNIATVYITITPENDPPLANFSYSPFNLTIVDTVIFTDISSDSDGTIVNWTWNFDDGNMSYLQNPTHQYADDGTYNVSLTVTDDYGSTNITLQHIFVYNSLTVYYIDVGQGDAILIQTPENNFVLIDAGKQSAASTVVNFLNNLSVNTLKAFIASHPDADHIGGADEVIENFDVLSIYHPGYEKDTLAYQEFITAAQNEGCPIYTDDDLDSGDFINISNIISCQILHIDKNASDSNDASIVLRVEFDLVSFLFTGDISSDVESDLIQDQNVDVDILKVAHHGSKFSTSDEFLNESTPILSVISVGSSNPYGHPTPETLTRLIAHNSSIFRTDLNGTITVTTFGTTWNVAVEKTMIPNEIPLANFTYYPSNPTILDTLQFTDTSEDEDGTMELWYWEFGDGDTSTLQNPTHQYADDGTYTVILNVTDDDGAANETTQQIVVANIAPVANDDCYSVAENGTLYVIAPGVLGNDTDAEGDPLNTSLISDVSNGALILFDNGSFGYAPTVGYNGTDSFTYKAFDGIDYSNEATVTIWVISNHPPYTPSNPSPSDGKTNVDKNKILSWSGGDPDSGDTVTYDVYFGISNPPSKISSNQSGTNYDPVTMSYNTKCYWKIITWDKNGTSAKGPIWSFTTEKESTQPPYNPPYNPPPTNQDPIANASASETSEFINTPVIFDGSLSSDEDGSITNYTWNFGDETTGYDDVTTHAYVNPGEYIVKLTVTDNEGATDDDTITVIISKPNIPPTVPELDGASNGTQNTEYTYSAVSTDADNDTIQYLFDWGDGKTTTTDFLPNGTATTQTHSWTTAGEYTISVKANDNETVSGITEYTVLIDLCNIDDEIKGYLVDNDGDGIYDSFHNETSNKDLDVDYNDGKYLIDDDGDGDWNYLYDSYTSTITKYSQSKKESILGIDNALLNALVIGLLFAIIILIIVFFIYRKKGKPGNKSKRVSIKKPKQSPYKKKGKK